MKNQKKNQENQNKKLKNLLYKKTLNNRMKNEQMNSSKGGFMKDFGKSKEHANMPQEVKIKDWPKPSHVGGELNDTITGIDEVNTRGVGKAKKHQSNQK
jgi:hypothetical protein